jgi:hypothetical protein
VRFFWFFSFKLSWTRPHFILSEAKDLAAIAIDSQAAGCFPAHGNFILSEAKDLAATDEELSSRQMLRCAQHKLIT